MSEAISKADCEPYNQELISWLLDRGVIYLDNEIIKCNKERTVILRELYDKDVISIHYINSPTIKDLICKGELVTDNKLLSKPEYQYLLE